LAWDWLQAPVEEEVTLDAESEFDEPDLAPAPTRSTDSGNDASLCLRAIFEAEKRYGLPENLLLALGLQEAGYQSAEGLTIWPWSVNAAGEGRRFKSRAAAINYVYQKQAEGIESIDIGCLQINLRWHPDAFPGVAEGFDPQRNINYAARFLSELYAESGDWWLAAGRYHSHSPEPQGRYLAGLKRNYEVAMARAPRFLALAARAPAGMDSAQEWASDWMPPRRAAPRREPTPFRTEGAIWSADLAGSEGDRRTLYSSDEIEPILPQFIESEV